MTTVSLTCSWNGGRTVRELRTCPVTGTLVILNETWVERRPDAPPPPPGTCPYCRRWPSVIMTAPGVGDTLIQAVPHPTPALGVEGDVRIRHEDGRVRRDAVGAHELIFGSHGGDDAAALRVVQARIADLRRDVRLRGFHIVRHAKPGWHPVWQLVALPIDVAPSAPAHWRDAELGEGTRLVGVHDDAVAILAWAPTVPFETWVLARTGRQVFEAADPTSVVVLVERIRARLLGALGPVRIDIRVVDGEPWRIELLPRLGASRPVEAATGLPLHGVFPERAARYLREVGSAGPPVGELSTNDR